MKILAISGGTKNGNNDAMAREALMGVKAVSYTHLVLRQYLIWQIPESV